MSKRSVWKRRLMVAGCGGFVPLVPFLSPDSCLTNTDWNTLFTNSGSAAIQISGNTAGNALGADVNAIVVQPTIDLFQAGWSNYVGERLPQDILEF